MRMRGFVIVMFALTLWSFTSGTDAEEKIEWGTKEITWRDFKGKSDNKEARAIAATNTVIDMQMSANDKGPVKVKLRTVLNAHSSWTITESNTILEHELKHFDICELYARKLRKKLSETKFSGSNYEDQVYMIYVQYNAEMDMQQDLYDHSTEHSLNLANQKEWNNNIKKELEVLKAYSSPEVFLQVNWTK